MAQYQPTASPDPLALSVPELAAQLRAGTLPLAVYLDALAARFATREPDLQAFVPEPDRFGRLQREAAALLAAYPRPGERPPLFGLPVGVKDIFHVDGFVTQAGSRVPAGMWAGSESAVVRQLKALGALILGKTVTTEFAYFAPGPTRNPHHLDHTPGGSSSGSAAAVAAGLCPLALGTQTIGSITRPAAYCGVVGYKPSYDRLSRAGVIPLAPSLDHVGLFAASVPGAALVASLLLAGWQPVAERPRPVLAIPDGPYLAHATAAGLANFAAACERLQTAGLVVRHVPAMPDFAAIAARHHLLMAAEAAEVHAASFARYGALYHAKTVDLIRRGQAAAPAAVALAREGRAQLRQELAALMAAAGIDLWLSPSAPGAAPAGLESTGDPIMNLPWSHAGLPTVTVPAGVNDQDLPFGLQLAGQWQGDEQLLAWAIDIEQILEKQP